MRTPPLLLSVLLAAPLALGETLAEPALAPTGRAAAAGAIRSISLGAIPGEGRVTLPASAAGRLAPPSLPPPPPAPAVLDRLFCTAATYPNCGLRAVPENAFHTRRLLAGQGPHGSDAVEFTLLPNGEGQFYMGWTNGRSGSVSAPARRYLRGWVWFPGRSGQRRGYHGLWSAKFAILSDGGDSSSRLIVEMRDDGRSADTIGIRATRNIDGDGPHVPFTLDQWHSWQVEVSAPAGVVKVWVDNNDYQRPNAVTTGVKNFGTSNWQNVGFGFYAGTTGVRSPTVALRMGAHELAAEFDPAWHR